MENDALLDQYLDAIWLESREQRLGGVEKADLLGYLGSKVVSGYSVRSSARQMSSLRGFYQYLMEREPDSR